MHPYAEDFYKPYQEGKRRSAREIVPLVLELIHPQNVIDVGCGVGTWLSVFRECGVEDVQGLDGDWVDKRMLQIPEERFLSFDLTKPFRMDREFENSATSQLSIVHPKKYLEVVERARELSDPRNMSLKKVLSALPILTKNACHNRFRSKVD